MQTNSEMNSDNILSSIVKIKKPLIIEDDDELEISNQQKNASTTKKVIKAKKSLIIEDDEPEINTHQKKVLTEDLGKIFEMAICLLYGINYDGKYKYSMEEANNIKEKLQKLKTVFPYDIKHIAKNGNKYDFECVDNDNIHLSAKKLKSYLLIYYQNNILVFD